MHDLTASLGFLLVGATLMLLLMGLGVAVFVPIVDRWSKRFFIAFFTILLLYGGLVLTEGIIGGRPGVGAALEVIYYFDTLLVSVLIPMMMAYLLHCCEESLRRSRLFLLEIALWIGFFIILNMTPFTTWFYYLSPEDQFSLGPLYHLMTAFLFALTLLTLGSVIRGRKKLPGRYYHAFLVGLTPITASILLHFFIPAFTFFGFGLTICALSMFVVILSDQIEQNLRQQQEIAHQRANVMVLQMRPHFIHNTMMCIYSLCNQDPQKARQVTMDFSTYLRKNFTAIASATPIPFSSELEHTRAYLAVVQAQYEDSLFVDYDTPHTWFRVPPLTLQPIVENAVKHGRDPYAGPFRISIRTRKTDSGTEITVTDNGRGFHPSDDGDVHVALNNIRQRLELMCGGRLTITLGDGGGTVVTVTVPDRAAE